MKIAVFWNAKTRRLVKASTLIYTFQILHKEGGRILWNIETLKINHGKVRQNTTSSLDVNERHV